MKCFSTLLKMFCTVISFLKKEGVFVLCYVPDCAIAKMLHIFLCKSRCLVVVAM